MFDNYPVLYVIAAMMIAMSARMSAGELIGDFRFDPAAPLRNEIDAGLPGILHDQFSEEHPPLLTGQEIPAGGTANGWALAWTKRVPQVGYEGWTASGCRIPESPQLVLGARFTLWMRVLYGGKIRGGGGYTLLTLDGPDGKPALDWRTSDEETDLILTARLRGPGGKVGEHTCRSASPGILLRNSRWYDLAVAFDKGKVTFYATPLARDGAGATESYEAALGAGLRLVKAEGPLWILKNINTAIEGLRVYRGEALSEEKVRALSEGVRIPGPKMTDRITVGTDRQLFLDDAVIDQMDDTVARRFHRARKYPGNPVIRKTHPKDVEGLGPVFWGSVIYDREEKLFKAWYQGLTFNAPEIFNHLYATSEDGILWTKPTLDIVGADNRYSPPGYKVGHAGMWLTLRKDPAETDPAKRYKGFIQHDAYWYVTSPDGLNWKGEGVAAAYTDDTTTCVRHAERGEYVKIGRFCPDGHNLALRLIMTCVSSTPLIDGNSPWRLVMLPDEKDLAGDPDLQFYYMPCFAYGNIYVGLLGIYHAGPESGISEPELVMSRDGLNWRRVNQGTPFIERGAPGAWDAGTGGAPGAGPIEVGDELWFYYGRYDGGHHGGYTKGGIGLAKLRRDGFVSLAASEEGGSVLTKPFTLAGDSVEINAAAKGGLTVQVLDRSGKVVAEGQSFTGDDCHRRVKWKKGADLSAWKGEEVAIRFLLRDAELYAFQVGDRRDLEARAKARASGYLIDEDPWETWEDPDKVERVTNPSARR